MFEHYIMGIPAPFSPGPLSNVSPGTCISPSTSYFPPFAVRRPSAHRMSSLDGLENALEALERGNCIEKDEVDAGVCGEQGRGAEMILGGEEESGEEKEERRHSMMQRRCIRGRETRRLAMVGGQGGGGSAQQFVEEAGKRQDDCASAFRRRMQDAVESGDRTVVEARETRASMDIATPGKDALLEATPFEFAQPRRHSVFYPSPPHEEGRVHARSASVSAASPASAALRTVSGPSAPWLKAYSSVIGKTHILERRQSFAGQGVLHARVQKKIYGRRGM